MEKKIITISCLILLAFFITQALASEVNQLESWSSQAPVKTPYGNVKERIKLLKTAKTVNEKNRHLSKLRMMGDWYAKEKKGYKWLEQIIFVLLEEIKNKDFPRAQIEAISGLNTIIEDSCGLYSLHNKVFLELKKVVTQDPTPDVRKAVLGVGSFYKLMECYPDKEITVDAVKTILSVLSTDPDYYVLDDAASTLRFFQENGVQLPENTKEVMEQAVRQRMMVMMPNQAWAAFARGPYKFHHWTQLHEFLIDSPMPDSGKVAADAIQMIGFSLKYANDLEKDSPVHVNILLLKYLLYQHTILHSSVKVASAELAYTTEAIQQDEETSLEERLKEIIANNGVSNFVNQAANVSAESSFVNRALKTLEKNGGINELIKKISLFVSVEQDGSTETRLAAWKALNKIQTDALAKKRSVFPKSVIEFLMFAIPKEKEQACINQINEFLKKLALSKDFRAGTNRHNG